MELGTVQTVTGKVDPARKFKCTTAAFNVIIFSPQGCFYAVHTINYMNCGSQQTYSDNQKTIEKEDDMNMRHRNCAEEFKFQGKNKNLQSRIRKLRRLPIDRDYATSAVSQFQFLHKTAARMTTK